jgi:hypothetical protein
MLHFCGFINGDLYFFCFDRFQISRNKVGICREILAYEYAECVCYHLDKVPDVWNLPGITPGHTESYNDPLGISQGFLKNAKEF